MFLTKIKYIFAIVKFFVKLLKKIKKMKIFKTSEDIVELFEEQFSEVGLESYGLHLKVMSVPKAKEIIKVSRANATTEHLSKINDLITIFVFEMHLTDLLMMQKQC